MSIQSISPIDGRYYSKVKDLGHYYSEMALIKYRTTVEINYLILLAEKNYMGLRNLEESEIKILKSLCDITKEDAQIVKKIETKGYENIPATNHDVKAIEYFIKSKLINTSLKDVLEIVHFGLTSEDINNTSYALMIKEGFNEVIFPALIKIYDQIYQLALEHKSTTMLARTHGQPASPTTFGKELLVFISRLKDEIKLLKDIKILAKLNGATGNYNAHHVASPDIDWIDFSKTFISLLNEKQNNVKVKYCFSSPLRLGHNKVTTQIEPHDCYSRVFDCLKRINTILIDFSQDIWRYISDGWIKQKTVKGEVGSSTMPHKVNPIDFENAEGNLGIANSLFQFFSSKLSVSRLQRDLSDSTVQRNIGVAFGHTLIAYKSLLKGLSKIEVNNEAISQSLQNCPEVIAEAIQSVLRLEGVEKPYELLKEVSRGKKTELNDYYELVNKLDIKDKTKQYLLSITPENYRGLADKIVDEFDPEIF